MTDQVLTALKVLFLALMYLFFGRVMWVVWSEVKGPRKGTSAQARIAAAGQVTAPTLAPATGTPDEIGRAHV